MASQTSSSGVAPQRPVPNPDTQTLYNSMRREEERLAAASLQSLHLPLSPSPATASPPLPASEYVPSWAGTSPPSPSYASTATSSVGGQTGRSQRSGRKGPLPQVTKLRAALLRKVRACDDCRKRKVKCAHLDFSLFEEAYQATKQSTMTQLADTDLNVSHAVAAPYRPRLGDSADLLGVGVGQSVLSPPPSSPLVPNGSGIDETCTDPDPLRNQQPRVQPHLAYLLSAFEGPQPPTLSAACPSHRFTVVLPTPPTPRTLPIGRQVTPFTQEWECMWEHGDSPPPLPGELRPCGQLFGSLEALELHFMHAHAHFRQARFAWRCVYCSFELSQLPDPGWPCPKCGQAELLSWRAWPYGDL